MTVRNLFPRVVRSLKSLAKRHGRSMEQEACEISEQSAGDRLSVMQLIEASWSRQARRPSAEEIEAWIAEGRR